MLMVNILNSLMIKIKHKSRLDPVPLRFLKTVPASSRFDIKAGDNIAFDCSYTGRPQPQIAWLKGKLPLNIDDTTLSLRSNNGR